MVLRFKTVPVHLSTTTQLKSNSGFGIQVLINSESARVKFNQLTDNEDNAIVISSSNSTEVYNNTIKENAGYGLQQRILN